MSDLFREQYVDLATRGERIRLFGEECLSTIPEDRLADGLTLEIGCGHGHWLTAYSEGKPDDPCIGIDLITKRIDKATVKGKSANFLIFSFLKRKPMSFLKTCLTIYFLKELFSCFPIHGPRNVTTSVASFSIPFSTCSLLALS